MLGLKLNHVSKRGHRRIWWKKVHKQFIMNTYIILFLTQHNEPINKTRDHSVYVPNQWEATLKYNFVSRRLGTSTKWSLKTNFRHQLRVSLTLCFADDITTDCAIYYKHDQNQPFLCAMIIHWLYLQRLKKINVHTSMTGKMPFRWVKDSQFIETATLIVWTSW